MLRKTLLCVIACIAASVHAIYEDEAFHIDYHQALLGLPLAHSTFFHRPQSSSNASLLYTASDNAVIGAVNPRDGSIVWRHPLNVQPVPSTSQAFLTAGSDGIVVSGFANTISAWDALSGRSVGSYTLGLDDRVISLQKIGEKYAALARTSAGGNRVICLDSKASNVLWEHKDPSADIPLTLSVSEERLYYLSRSSALLSSAKLKSIALDPTNGHEIKQTSLALNPDSLVESSLYCATPESSLPILAAVEAPFKSIKFGTLDTGKVISASLSDKSDDVKAVVVHQSCSSTKGQSHVLVHVKGSTKQWADVFHIDSHTADAVLAYSLPATAENSVFASSQTGGPQYFTRITDSEVSLYSSESHGQLGRWPRVRSGPSSASLGGNSHATAEVVARGKSGAAIRVAELSGVGEWSLIRNGETQWTRPEFLANGVIAAWADEEVGDPLAAELKAETASNPVMAYIHRWTRHTDSLQYLPELLSDLVGVLFTSQGMATSGSKNLAGSYTVVVGTSRLEVAALNAVEFGSVKWRTDISVVTSLNTRIISLSVQQGRVTAYLADGSVAVLDLHNGRVIEHKSLTMAAEKIIEIPGQPTPTVVKIDSDGRPSLASDLSPSTATEGNMLVTLRSSGEATGWTVGQDVRSLWSIHPAEAKFIHGAARPSFEPIASIGKVLGNRTVLYKHISPNMALLTAVSSSSKVLSMYLVESVSGNILHVSTHPGVDSSSPISSVISENWFVYSFTSKDPESHAPTSYLVSAELFESQIPNDRGALEQTVNYSSVDPGSSTKPYVVSQSFVLTEPISHMSVSQTSQGITTRQLLAVLPQSNAIAGIHHYQFDPRRPIGRNPTANELEEGLTAYSPVLELDPKLYLTHSRDVLGIQKLISRPTLLESTSLVFGFGHDIFGTRVTPSLAYDVLNKGFNKVQLLFTISALSLGVMVLAPMAKRIQAETRWKS